MNGSRPLALSSDVVRTAHVSDKSGKTLLRECHELLKAGNKASDQKALRLAKQACILRPADGACYLQAARALSACGHHVKALKALEKAERCRNGGGEATKELGRRLRNTQPTRSLLSLPDELIVQTLAYLTVPDVARAQRTNKRLNAIVRTHCELWRRLPRITATHDDPRSTRLAVEGIKDIVRRADGKLYTADIYFAGRSMKAPAHTELFSPFLEAIPADFLCELHLALRGLSNTRAAAEVPRLCRDGRKLETLSLDVGEQLLTRALQPIALWPQFAPPLTSLALKSVCGWSGIIDWLTRFKDTLETFTCSSIRGEALYDEDGPVEAVLPKLTSFSIRPVSAVEVFSGAKPIKLRMPALKKLTWGYIAMDTLLVGNILTPDIEHLAIDLLGENQEALCAALPSMTKLEHLALGLSRVEGKCAALRVLADNPFVPLRCLHIQHAYKESGADVARLVRVRLQGPVPIEELRLVACPDLLPQHAAWLRRNVKTVFISALEKVRP